MFRGFNLRVDTYDCFKKFYQIGMQLHEGNKDIVNSKINSFKGAAGEILASKVSAAWFPPVKADVFISHAHSDSALAIGLSGYLKEEFGLDSFIDSCVWGYSDRLLQILDNQYCWNADSSTYNYDTRNRSTAHVHMILTAALARMIDQSECVMFLNTPNSITGDYISGAHTESPWIFTEVLMTSLIKLKVPDEHWRLRKSYAALDEAMRVSYEVPTSHLSDLDVGKLNSWRQSWHQNKIGFPLDRLYGLIPNP